MIAALPLSVSAAGEYVPGNPRWSGYQNQVQWDRPAGAASGDSFEYEAQLLLGDDVVESKAVEIDTYAECVPNLLPHLPVCFAANYRGSFHAVYNED